MENDYKIFGDKNFSDLSEEIYENTKLKKTQIDLLIQEVHGYIQGIEDIAVVGPIIKELMDALLSEEEKEQLMATLEDVTTDLQKKKDEIVDMSDVRSKYGKT